MDNEYRIIVNEQYVGIKGGLPVTDMKLVAALAKKYGFTIMDAQMAKRRGLALCFTSPAHAKKLRDDYKGAPVPNDSERRLSYWSNGPDTGISSGVIFEVLSGRQINFPPESTPPRDADDFGRCHRLLELFPGWRERMPEVAARYPGWATLIERWTELTSLFNGGEFKAVDDRIREWTK